ncbi:cytochrome P450 [Actinotalea sp. BY-33]|uniref:Cytochrome P450 n=2 Tax=Actinotalea soli TaxID=2819234 RepID=A0A939RSC6_9CELL|nr:cytochrome P450 [Actinotalea soli]
MAGLLLTGHLLARRGGVVRVPHLGWVTADPVVGRRVLGDHRSFTLVGEGGVGHLWAQILGPWVLDLFDGPGHHDLRSRSRELFTEATSSVLVDTAWQGRLAQAREQLRAGERLDVAHLSRVLVGRMMIGLLGMPAPPDRADSSAAWPTDREAEAAFRTGEELASLALGSAASTVLSPAQVHAAQQIVGRLTAGVPDGWRHAGQESLLGRCRALGLGLEETTGLASLLMVAGTETSASAMARTTALLIDTGEQHRLLAAMRSPEERSRALTGAVREGLRSTSPASVIGRGVQADVEVEGRHLRAGERVMILTWSATTAPGPFRVDRPYLPETRQLWFGAGRHLCLGAALARTEVSRLLETLWGDGVALRVVRRRAERRVLVPGYARLEVARA